MGVVDSRISRFQMRKLLNATKQVYSLRDLRTNWLFLCYEQITEKLALAMAVSAALQNSLACNLRHAKSVNQFKQLLNLRVFFRF